jgi:hypothetical protein
MQRQSKLMNSAMEKVKLLKKAQNVGGVEYKVTPGEGKKRATIARASLMYNFKGLGLGLDGGASRRSGASAATAKSGMAPVDADLAVENDRLRTTVMILNQ